MIGHLLDGTYELFRQFYGRRRIPKPKGEAAPFGAVAGVLHSVLEMIEGGATHLGVATDHVVESFRNRLWPGYKTSAGLERTLLAQFHPLEEALAAMGVVVWPMTELRRTTPNSVETIKSLAWFRTPVKTTASLALKASREGHTNETPELQHVVLLGAVSGPEEG